MHNVTYRDLTSLSDFATVVDLEQEIWGPGYTEPVPVPILVTTVKLGGILVGAFEGERMIGFVYSHPGLRHGRPMQWSHMAGVVAAYRNSGIGHHLKLLQRERALAMGLDLIEWTFDPMQAMNAHLNFAKLGVIVEEYEENVYGASQSPLHRGNPTDRFVAEWRICEPHVARRLTRRGIPIRTDEIASLPSANRVVRAGEWPECRDVDLDIDGRRLLVEIPMGFTEMLTKASDRALTWRMETRRIFTSYFARAFRAVDFHLDRASGKGAYLLAARDAAGHLSAASFPRV
jgi:predicted GNAT superfamily acetyltransferase